MSTTAGTRSVQMRREVLTDMRGDHHVTHSRVRLGCADFKPSFDPDEPGCATDVDTFRAVSAAILRGAAKRLRVTIDQQRHERGDGGRVRTHDGLLYTRTLRLSDDGHGWVLDLTPAEGELTPRLDLDPRIILEHAGWPLVVTYEPSPPLVDVLTGALVTAPHGPDAHGVPVAA